MLSLGPISSSLAEPMSNKYEFVPSEPGPPTEQLSNIACFSNFVAPPEMPDAVKAAASKGSWCYYGFYFTDDAVNAFNKARNIDCPPDVSPRKWMLMRKHDILNDTSSALGIRFSTNLAWNGDDQDIVYFAYKKKFKFVKALCLPAEKIKELMAALGQEGEPQWIIDANR